MNSSRYSKNRVKAAGKLLRSGWKESESGAAVQALRVLESWRKEHADPLRKATMGLRSRVTSSRCNDPKVSQRLKRRYTIIHKLWREPTMQLTTMHDIAGCRAVLGSIEEVKAVSARWMKKRGRVHKRFDYITNPKPTGYRGEHLVVQYDGFMVEVQLRTRLQHAWATAVEQVGSAIEADLKSGYGPPDILNLFKLLGDLLSDADHHKIVSPETIKGIQDLAGEIPDPVLKMIGLEVKDGTLSFRYMP